MQRPPNNQPIEFIRFLTGHYEAYVAIARRHGLDPAQMALAYVHSRRFLTSAIIGARTPEQLENNLDAGDLVLDPPVIDDIEAIHESNPDPAP